MAADRFGTGENGKPLVKGFHATKGVCIAEEDSAIAAELYPSPEAAVAASEKAAAPSSDEIVEQAVQRSKGKGA